MFISRRTISEVLRVHVQENNVCEAHMKIINLFKFPQCVTWDPKPTKYGIPHYILGQLMLIYQMYKTSKYPQ